MVRIAGHQEKCLHLKDKFEHDSLKKYRVPRGEITPFIDKHMPRYVQSYATGAKIM